MTESNEITDCKINELLVLSDRFKVLPPLAVELRISDVVPQDLDVKWHKDATKRVAQWISKYKNQCHIRGEIVLTLMDCIWVKSVELVQKLSSINEDILSFSIKKHLIDEHMGVKNENALKLLRNMAEERSKFSLFFIASFHVTGYLDIYQLAHQPLLRPFPISYSTQEQFLLDADILYNINIYIHPQVF